VGFWLYHKEKGCCKLQDKNKPRSIRQCHAKASEYFRQRKSEDPTFYFDFSLDEEKKVKNIF
jgi:hypothetical protein